MKKVVFFVAMAWMSLLACTSSDEAGSQGDYYADKARLLAQSCGVFYERESSAPPMSKEEYEELERFLNQWKEHADDTIALNLVKKGDSILVFSNAPYEEGMIKEWKEETIGQLTDVCQGVTFTASVTSHENGYSVYYDASAESLGVTGLNVKVKSTSINDGKVTFTAEGQTDCQDGSSRPYAIKGVFNVNAGSGSMSVSPLK